MPNVRKAAEIARKVADNIARLEREIGDRRADMAAAKARPRGKQPGWYDLWERRVMALARAVGQLERLRKRLPGAKGRAAQALKSEREATAKEQRHRAENEAFFRRLDALRDAAPAIKEQWDRDRRDEDARLKKIKRRLMARTTKDLTSRTYYVEKPITLSPPVQQPDLSEPESTVRAVVLDGGLIPRSDAERHGIVRLLAPAEPSTRWTWRAVGYRLIDAHRVLARIPVSIFPKEFGRAWPAYRPEAGDLAIQAGAGTLDLGRNVSVRSASAEEIAGMNEALGWIMQFLSNNTPGALISLNEWAREGDIEAKDTWVIQPMLQFIADALNAAREVVR